MRRRWVGTPGSATSWQTRTTKVFRRNNSEMDSKRVSAIIRPSASSARSRRTSRGGVSREVVSALVRKSRRSRPVDEPEPEPEPGGRHARARDTRERSIAGGKSVLVSARRGSRATVGLPTGPGGGHATCEQQERSV